MSGDVRVRFRTGGKPVISSVSYVAVDGARLGDLLRLARAAYYRSEEIKEKRAGGVGAGCRTASLGVRPLQAGRAGG